MAISGGRNSPWRPSICDPRWLSSPTSACPQPIDVEKYVRPAELAPTRRRCAAVTAQKAARQRDRRTAPGDTVCALRKASKRGGALTTSHAMPRSCWGSLLVGWLTRYYQRAEMDDHFESVNLMVDDRPVTSAENWRLRRVAGLFAATSFVLAIVGPPVPALLGGLDQRSATWWCALIPSYSGHSLAQLSRKRP